MESRSWQIKTESERSDAIFDLKAHGYKAGRSDRYSGSKALVVKAESDDWGHVERIIRARAPSAKSLDN